MTLYGSHSSERATATLVTTRTHNDVQMHHRKSYLVRPTVGFLLPMVIDTFHLLLDTTYKVCTSIYNTPIRTMYVGGKKTF